MCEVASISENILFFSEKESERKIQEHFCKVPRRMVDKILLSLDLNKIKVIVAIRR